jgi:hypothetical protein
MQTHNLGKTIYTILKNPPDDEALTLTPGSQIAMSFSVTRLTSNPTCVLEQGHELGFRNERSTQAATGAALLSSLRRVV